MTELVARLPRSRGVVPHRARRSSSLHGSPSSSPASRRSGRTEASVTGGRQTAARSGAAGEIASTRAAALGRGRTRSRPGPLHVEPGRSRRHRRSASRSGGRWSNARRAGAASDRTSLEAIVFVESAGRPDVLAGDDVSRAAGLTQIVAATGRQFLGMHVDTDASRRSRADQSGRASRTARSAQRLGGAPPPCRRAVRAAEVAARNGALPRRRRRTISVATISRSSRTTWASGICSTSSPRTAARRLVRAALLRLGARRARRGVATPRVARRHVARLLLEGARGGTRHAAVPPRSRSARLRGAAPGEEELRRGGHAPALPDAALPHAGRDRARVEASRPATRSRATASGRTSRSAASWARRRTSSAVPVASTAACVRRRSTCCSTSAQRVHELSGARSRCIVTSAVRDNRYQRVLMHVNPNAARTYSLHTTGYAFDIARSYASERQAAAFQFVLDRLQAVNAIAYIREARRSTSRSPRMRRRSLRSWREPAHSRQCLRRAATSSSGSCREEALEATRDAVFAAGAGRIGDYERCSWYTAGTGTFLARRGRRSGDRRGGEGGARPRAARRDRRARRARGRGRARARRRASLRGGRVRAVSARGARRVKARLSTDGGARGNPGPAAYGYVLEAEDGTVLAAHGETDRRRDEQRRRVQRAHRRPREGARARGRRGRGRSPTRSCW